ncbi:MAG: ABC transporter permease [Candidatus Korarchaeota archaeon]
MDILTITLFLALAVRMGTPLLLACLGEIYAERSGILNLGIEGTMMLGAAMGFIAAYETQNLLVGFVAAALVGSLLGLLHAIIVIFLRGNQTISGLAITFAGIGLSMLIAHEYVGKVVRGSLPVVPLFSDVPILSAFFNQNIMVYFAYVASIVMWFVLFHTRIGIEIRATGESPIVAESAGVNVERVRLICAILSGAFAGLGGAYISLIDMRSWTDLLTASKGWIALALVLVSLWNPLLALFTSYLFGALYAFQVFLRIDINLAKMVPYAATIPVLAIASKLSKRVGVPILGKPYIREEEALHGV